MSETITLTRTVTDAGETYTETVTYVRNGDEVRATQRIDGAITSDGVEFAGPDAERQLDQTVRDAKVEGWSVEHADA